MTVLSPVLHTAAMLLFPAMMGLSTSLCLARSPSPYSIVAVHEYLTRTRWLDRIWVLAAGTWLAMAGLRSLGIDSALGSGVGAMVLATIAWAAAAGFLVWMQVTLAAELASAAFRVVDEGGPVASEDEDGTIVALRREACCGDDAPGLPSAHCGKGMFAVSVVLALAAYVVVSFQLGAAASTERFMQCLLVGGFYCSLGVFFVDLIQDVWPGFTTKRRLQIAARYYVQIFEQWVNYGVLASFLTVLIGAPIAWARGYAPVAVISFPVWIAGCLCFATFFNQVLNRNGLVASRLPLPVYVNEYSVARPLWAHFFTVIHVVMALVLFAGLIAVSGTIHD